MTSQDHKTAVAMAEWNERLFDAAIDYRTAILPKDAQKAWLKLEEIALSIPIPPAPAEPQGEALFLYDHGEPTYLDGAEMQYVVLRGRDYPWGQTVAYVDTRADAQRIMAALSSPPPQQPAQDYSIAMREALELIAEWPITNPKKNMDALNMQHVAKGVLANIAHSQGDAAQGGGQ